MFLMREDLISTVNKFQNRSTRGYFVKLCGASSTKFLAPRAAHEIRVARAVNVNMLLREFVDFPVVEILTAHLACNDRAAWTICLSIAEDVLTS